MSEFEVQLFSFASDVREARMQTLVRSPQWIYGLTVLSVGWYIHCQQQVLCRTSICAQTCYPSRDQIGIWGGQYDTWKTWSWTYSRPLSSLGRNTPHHGDTLWATRSYVHAYNAPITSWLDRPTPGRRLFRRLVIGGMYLFTHSLTIYLSIM